ncbi:MAG: hypothetical protein OQK76_02355 [Gammaproteobacteria bacterium]|nr:hypothetical protein [Gammaproteobacteria bacterium]
MNIPHLYVYLSTETLIVLIIVCTLLFIRNKKLSKLIESLKKIIKDLKKDTPLDENSFDLSNDYTGYLTQELERNQKKIKTLDTIPLDDEDSETTQKNEINKNLLNIRDKFLNTEKKATDHNEDENAFWESIYSDIQNISDKHFTQKEEIINLEEIQVEKVIKKTIENVIHIEPQGKKIDAEVNKLKDIIYEQENSLSSLSRALQEASKNKDDSEIPEELVHFNEQLGKLERNVEESKVCMEILETENDRLQGELSEFETKYNEMCDQLASGTSAISSSAEPLANENVEQLKSALEEQNGKISALTDTVDDLQLEAKQAEKLKATLKEFTQGSKEMMTCITILEEENERLLTRVDELEKDSPQTDDADATALKQKTEELEQELIKKDVAYAKLQDEYVSMEKEYLSMYEAMHNDE